MTPIRLLLASLVGAAALGSLIVTPALATPPTPSLVTKLDKNDDETLSLDEVKTAAGARFDTLERDGDGTLDAKEVQGLIGAKTFKKADHDNDGTLSKDEYLPLVEKLFAMADADGDGTLDVEELRSPNAKLLKRLTH